MNQQPHDAYPAGPARPHYPPPDFPPPAAAPYPGAGAYPGYPQPQYGAMVPQQAAWAPASAPPPSPMWGLTIPAAVLAFPIGLVAVYFSTQVNARLQAGDHAGAAKNAGLAKTWGIVFLVLGVIFTLLYLGTV